VRQPQSTHGTECECCHKLQLLLCIVRCPAPSQPTSFVAPPTFIFELLFSTWHGTYFSRVHLWAKNHNDTANRCGAFRSHCQLSVVIAFPDPGQHGDFYHHPTLMGSLICRMAKKALKHEQHYLLPTPRQLSVGSGGGSVLAWCHHSHSSLCQTAGFLF